MAFRIVPFELVGTDRRILEELEPRLREWGDGQACAMLALVAGEGVSLPEQELVAARRRALLVLAAGGDPHRELELDGRGVTGLADDLDSPGRRAELEASLRALKSAAQGLPRASFLLDAMLEDGGLAWRSLAVALLADELSE
ncbi:MAG: hypothetical protein ACRDNH_02820 [Gaiellaceae bacterium]